MIDRDRAFIEVGYKRARCGNHEEGALSIDHIDSDHHNSQYANLIILCHSCHHMKTSGKSVTLNDIEKLKAGLIRKTLTEHGANAIKLCYRNSFGIIAMPFLVNHLVDLGYLNECEVQMGYGGGDDHIDATVRYEITEKGKKFHERWKEYL